jgi:hypothetical protein
MLKEERGVSSTQNRLYSQHSSVSKPNYNDFLMKNLKKEGIKSKKRRNNYSLSKQSKINASLF